MWIFALALAYAFDCPSTSSEIETPDDPRLKGGGTMVVFKKERHLGLYVH